MKKTRLNLTTKLALAGLCLSALLVVSHTGLAAENPADILTKVAAPIKDIVNRRELEGATFHVINITEHDSVLPAELRLAGTEADWAEGVIGYVDGKEVPTGLMPSSDHVRLMVNVPLKPREVKKVTFKKGKGAAASDLKMEQEGNRVVVSNRQSNWKLGPNGMEQFQRADKTFILQETGISNGTVKATLTPAVCRVTLQVEGASAREYLFYPNSSLWQVNADKNYQLVTDGTNAFYYAHPCARFYGDPGSPYGAVIETSELEKGTYGLPGPKEFLLFSGVDWGMLMGNGIGLGVYPNPSAHTILVDTTKRKEGVFVHAVPIDERSNTIFKKWHWMFGAERFCGCGYWRTQTTPLSNLINYVLGVAADVKEGTFQRSASLAPIVLRSLGDRLHGAQVPWITANLSETIYVENFDGKCPDMLNNRWYWCSNGKPMSCFEFNDSNKDGVLDDVYIYAKWDDKGGELDANKLKLAEKLDEGGAHANGDDKRRALDSMELKYPVCALHDWTRDGKIVANCVFFGGRIDQDWFEFNSGIEMLPPDRAVIERKKPTYQRLGAGVSPLAVKKFDRIIHVLDLDSDGDMDIAEENRMMEDPDMAYDLIWYRRMYCLDRYDNNPFLGVSLDPFAGNLTTRGSVDFSPVTCCGSSFRYKGIPVSGPDVVGGNVDLDGDGLPEAKLQFNAGLFDDYFVFQPMSVMICSSLFLENRHALNKINNWVWQEGNGHNSCFKTDVGLFTIRKNASWPYNDIIDRELCQGTHRMPKRAVKNSITTYHDKWGNKIRFVGLMQPTKWDGRLVAGSKDMATVKDWSDSFHFDWDYLLATFEGVCGAAWESGYTTHFPRWEFCPDYAQRRQAKLFYSELDGRLHLKGASWGHRSPYTMGGNPKHPAPLDEFGRNAYQWLHEGYFGLDCDTLRYYASAHEAFFDEDGDGYLDSFLVDADNDGLYEDRIWYDQSSRTIACMKNGIMVLYPHNMEPYPEEELLLDTEHYDKLVALKRMSLEKTSFLKETIIKTTPLSISVPGSNIWMGLSGDLLPLVLLDTAHCETGIWHDLSPKGYSRLLTGLQRQKAVVRELKEKWSEASLRGAAVLFAAPPYTMKPNADELKAMDAFLKRGGRMVVAYPDWSSVPQSEVYALKADNPLAPDGQAGEWASPLGMDLALTWDKPKSYRVKIQVSPKWDKTHFYLYAEVYDRDLVNKEDGGLIWKGDCIQFVLGDLGEKWQNFAPGMGPDDVVAAVRASGGKWQEYGMAHTQRGPQLFRWVDTLANRTGPVAGAKLQVTRQENRTVYQLALPWTEVGTTNVQVGATLGFALWVWDRAGNGEIQRLTMGNIKRPDQFRKLILVDRPDATNACAGAMVESPLDAMCSAYGIRRNPEHTALVSVVDPHFRNRGMGPEVWNKFKGERSEVLIKDVRKLYFNGSSLCVSNAAETFIEYQDKIIGTRTKVGKGELLVLCSDMMLNNKCSCFHTYAFEGGDCSPNEMPFDKLIDAKPDNNIFLDNLARYLVANQKRFKVFKAGDEKIMIELAGPGQVYVNKGVKVTADGKESISGKENGDTVCFEVPASKAPIKLKISR